MPNSKHSQLDTNEVPMTQAPSLQDPGGGPAATKMRHGASLFQRLAAGGYDRLFDQNGPNPNLWIQPHRHATAECAGEQAPTIPLRRLSDARLP
jgi:hypothetical protein